jgi:hypothetical protein
VIKRGDKVGRIRLGYDDNDNEGGRRREGKSRLTRRESTISVDD